MILNMMRRILTSFIALLSLLATAQVQLHVIEVGNFNRLSLIDNINVNYRCNADSAGLATFTGSKELASHLMFNLSSNGRLNIQFDDIHESMDNLPTITVYSSAIDEVENSSDSTLRVSGLPPMKTFKVRNIDNGKVILSNVRASQLELQILSGKGKIIANGTCDVLSLRLIGTGEIQADQVVATDVSCRIMGTGTIGCHVDGGELKVSGSGTGKVYYKGNPSKVNVRKLGTIKAIPMQ